MRHSRLSPFLRLSAAKSPSLLNQVSRVSIGAFLTALIVSVSAAVSTPDASAQAVTFTGSGAVTFGSVNVCPSGKTTPAPCSNTLTLSYNVTASGTLGTPQVLTTGAPDLDFTLASGSSCTGSVTQGNTCTVNVTFAPTVPGQRNGAVEIVDTSGDVLATTYIYGSAVGPLAGFGPPALSTLITATLPGSIISSIAVDGSGNVFAASEGGCSNGNGSLIEIMAVNGSIPPNPVIRCFLGNFYPVYMAFDGAGNLFGGTSTTVVEILAAGDYTTVKNISSSFTEVGPIRVDDSGNIFAIEQGSYPVKPAVKELLAANGYATTITLGSGFAPYNFGDLALDNSGNVFVSEPSYGEIAEILAAGGYSTVKTIHVSNNVYGSPTGLAFDSANNLYGGLETSVGEFFAVDGVIPEEPAALYLPTTGAGEGTTWIALDGRGNISTANYNFSTYTTGYMQELQFSTPPTLSFASTSIGQTSTDSPKSVQLQNKGNATLDLSALSVSPNWELVPGSGTPADCTASSSLLAAAECNLSISFTPTEAGPLTGAVTLVDNSVPETQSIPLSGTGTGSVATNITGLSANYGAWYAIITLTGTGFGASQGSSTVTFNGVVAPVLSWSATNITVSVPYRATTGSVVVTVNSQASNAVAFSVKPTPSVTGISPTSGPVGTLVTISGQNLLDAENHGSVYMADTLLPIVSQSSTSLQVRIPIGAVTGVFNVHVNGVGLGTPVFTVPGSPANPHLTSLSASYGALYAVISLNGTGFGAAQGSSTVTFNGDPATAYLWNNTGITVTVPNGATTGNVVVTVAEQPSNGIPFTIEPTPTVTGVTPASGTVGTLITIDGTNLANAQTLGSVWFGNINAPIVAHTNTDIQVMVPAGATTGPIDVHVNGVGNYTPVFTVN